MLIRVLAVCLPPSIALGYVAWVVSSLADHVAAVIGGATP